MKGIYSGSIILEVGVNRSDIMHAQMHLSQETCSWDTIKMQFCAEHIIKADFVSTPSPKYNFVYNTLHGIN